MNVSAAAFDIVVFTACDARRDFQRGEALGSPDLVEQFARHRERDVDRRDLIDHDQRRGAVGLNQIAFVHEQGASPAGGRRADARVLEIETGGGNGGLVRGGRGFQRRGGRDLGVVLLARNQAALEQILEPVNLYLRIVGLRRIAREHRGGLVESHLERLRVDREQRLAGSDVLAFGKVHLRNASGHLRADLHGRDRLCGAHGHDRHRHRLLDRGGRDHGNGRTIAAAAAGTGTRRRLRGSLLRLAVHEVAAIAQTIAMDVEMSAKPRPERGR